MSMIRTSCLTAFIICMPLIIWLWGAIANNDIATDITPLIKHALSILYCLQLSALLLSTTFYQSSLSLREYYPAILLLILMPAPFYSIAWLAGVISIIAIIKMTIMLLTVAFFTLAVKHLFNLLQWPVKLDIFSGIIASVLLWSTRLHWQAWLN